MKKLIFVEGENEYLLIDELCKILNTKNFGKIYERKRGFKEESRIEKEKIRAFVYN